MPNHSQLAVGEISVIQLERSVFRMSFHSILQDIFALSHSQSLLYEIALSYRGTWSKDGGAIVCCAADVWLVIEENQWRQWYAKFRSAM